MTIYFFQWLLLPWLDDDDVMVVTIRDDCSCKKLHAASNVSWDISRLLLPVINCNKDRTEYRSLIGSNAVAVAVVIFEGTKADANEWRDGSK